MSEAPGKPLLASLVLAGEGQTDAVAIADFIYMVKDISNAYLVQTGDGDVLINAGFMDSAARNQALLAKVRSGPLRRIVVTQGHPDHFGGVPLLREPGTQLIAQRRFVETCEHFRRLMPYFRRRSAKLWGGTIRRAAPLPPPELVPDVCVDECLAFEQGGRRFELVATPGGEAPCSLVVWLPRERVVFTGNLFGPVFLSMPNLCTVRGDKPRSARQYLASLEVVRALGAELLVTGHGEPIRGAERIRADLDRMHAAVTHVEQAVVAGMNDGRDVHALMREIHLPAELALGEYHGKVAWAVRTIWEEYSGWFHYDSTTSLYAVERAAVDADLVELAGGAGAMAQRAGARLAQGQALQALHLLDIALHVHPRDAEALAVKRDALQHLLQQSGGSNLSEVMWLKSEIAAVESALAAT